LFLYPTNSKSAVGNKSTVICEGEREMKKMIGGLAIGAVSVLTLVFYLASLGEQATPVATLTPNDKDVVSLGEEIYAQNCKSCHGTKLEGQANWRQRDANGYMLAPPHNESGHSWHHSDDYLFSMTKYGIEKMIGKKYPNNMPVYEGQLSDEQIIAALSYIKSTWSRRIQRQHDQINTRANAHKKEG
jgi:mono/diheme cytochrome c family protein